MPTKRAVYPVEFKALNDATGQVEALVSIFDNIDLQGDRVVPGAFRKSIAAWKASGDPVPVIFSHEWGDIWSHIGVVDSMEETAKGLRSVYTLDIADNPAAAQVYKLMKRRSLKEHSFAYEVRDEKRAKDGANDLIELDIIEIGPTLRGANPDTELIAVKSLLAAEAAKQTGHSTSLSGRKVYLDADLPGTFEETRDAIGEAARALLNPSGDQDTWVGVEATFPDHALVSVMRAGEEEHYQIDWSTADDGTITLGEPVAVEVEVTVTPKSAKAGRRLSQATQTEMQSIRDHLAAELARMDALMGVAEDAATASSETSAGAKTAAADLDTVEASDGKSEIEGLAAKSPDASVTALLTRIAEMRALTGITE